jgi:drug/metabolite transporter (DMT)-like permease
MSAARVGRAEALLAAILFSTGGAGLKAGAFTTAQMSGLRSGIAALALLAWLAGARQLRWTRVTALAAVFYAATVTLFVVSTRLTTAASAIFLQSTAPLLVSCLGPVLLGERVQRRDLPFLALMACGLVLSFTGYPAATATAPDPARGNLLALFCSATWALTLISLRHMERASRAPGAGLTVVALGNLLAAVVAAPYAWPLPAASAADWMAVAYLGVGQIALAYACLTAAVRKLPALDVSLLLLVEPVLNPVWTWIIHGEEPGAAVVAGGAIILVATALRAMTAGAAIDPSGRS